MILKTLRFIPALALLALLLGPVSYPGRAQSDSPPEEWTQHAANARHTSFVPQEIPTPWRWKWAWNGPDEAGGVRPDKFSLPRNVQPITGGMRVYITAGERGVYALDLEDGAELWHQNTLGPIHSTAAYDPHTQTVVVLSTSGIVHKLDAASGEPIAQFDTGAPSDYPLPPAIHEQTVFVATGQQVVALNIATFEPNWSYTLPTATQTPPAYSPSTNRVIVAAEDLHVYAINNADGSLIWQVKPTVRETPEDDIDYINGWPVIAEQHGLVFIKARLDWDTLWTWDPWPTTNEAIRENLTQRPDQQALFALNLSDGTSPFIINVGHGGYGDGGYMPMGPQPAVKTLSDGSEVVVTIGRGDDVHDARWDSKFVEIVLDSTTVPGYSGGEVRFIHYHDIILTDEQPNITAAGNQVLAGHWMAGYSLQITDRDAALGNYGSPIRSTALPHIVTSSRSCAFSPSHYCGAMVQDNDVRQYPAGFYIYHGQGTVYDAYWSEYSTWVVSGTTILYRSTDGAIIALESSAEVAATPPPTLSVHTESEAPVSTLALASLPHIDYRQARAYAGEWVRVTGTIEFLFNNGKHVYLGFANPHRGSFKVMIPKEAWDNFAEAPEQMYQTGQQITAAGRIRWYQGDPVIEATSPAQIWLRTPQIAAQPTDEGS